MLYFSVKKGIIHSHRDLNSVSSSTDKTNLLGPIPSRLRSPGPRVNIRVAVSSDGGNTSLRLKPVVRNSMELISIVTGDVPRGTGTPKNRDEVNKREVCECFPMRL
jgi:hypothetical protein